MTRVAQVAFAVLVAATLAAFLVTQRLKQTPRLVQTLAVSKDFSPRTPFTRAGIRIRLKRTDDATVSVLDEDGDVVRRLVRNRRYRKNETAQLFWNGRDTSGAIVPDGSYRVRVNLRRQGRSVTLVDEIRVDGTPPRPVVVVDKPEEAQGPLIISPPLRRPVRFRVENVTVRGTPVFRVYRTDGRRPVAVTRLRATPGATEGEWNGQVARLPRAAAGTYAIAVQVRDRAGNVGSSYPFAETRRGPRGSPGVTVRYVAGQAPLRATRAGRPIRVFVDARRAPYRWRLHRLGQTRTLARGGGRGPLLRPQAPSGPSGVYLLKLRARGKVATVPVLVTGRSRERVLLVMPLVTWQGLNPVDDDGDGEPDTLERGGSVRIARPFAGRGEPPGFGRAESPLLRLLDRPRQRYDLETDYGALRRGPRFLRGYKGVVLAGNPRWLEPAFGRALRAYVEDGGKVFSLGTDSLRREVRVRRGLLVNPSGESAFDLFGSSIGPVTRRGVDLLAGDDAIGLFEGTDGEFSGFDASEETRDPGEGNEVVSSAATENGRPVIVALRSGRGLVVRTGLPQWPQRLDDVDVAQMTRQVWRIFSR